MPRSTHDLPVRRGPDTIARVPTVPRPRNDSIDLLRGLVMVIMALDHTRDFFGGALGDPTDLATTTVPLFLTRWVTHFCAPVFLFLAGTSAWFAGARRTRGALARFLITRGLWLIVLELTIVRIAWSFDVGFHRFTLQVIWALGASMIVLSALVFLPLGVTVAFGALLILAHDATDHVRWHSTVWTLAHVPGVLHATPSVRVFALYPLIPWAGVMALGYAFGAWMQRPTDVRRRRMALTGAFATVGFVALRGLNRYGDPEPWVHGARPALTVLSFLNCEKYPPSLAYLLMTLGPALLLLAAVDGKQAPVLVRPLVTFGRVPLFYYVAHLYLLHGVAALVAMVRHVPGPHVRWGAAGLGLGGVYVAWACAVVALYPACHWFAAVKARRRDWWLSYL